MSYDPNSNLERLAGWGLWWIYWKIFTFFLTFLVLLGALLLYCDPEYFRPFFESLKRE